MHFRPIGEQVVVIVGASSGIGRATALAFARQGARVVVAAQDDHGLASLVSEIRRGGGSALPVTADVADFAQVQRVGAQAVEAFGRIDTWVHCAAVGLYATFEQSTPEEFDRVIQVNLLGQVYGAMVALPLLRGAGGGSLIHISSVEGKRSLPFHSAYGAAKHGIDGFVESMRVELAREGAPINVVQIMPASIDTPFFLKSRTKIGVTPRPAPPVYDPSSVANAILFASEHRARDIIVGGAGLAIVANQRLSPRLLDRAFTRFGFRPQKTDQPEGRDAPSNFFDPMPTDQYDTVRGGFDGRRSMTIWLEIHPLVRQGMTAAAMVAAGAYLIGRDKDR